MGRIAHDQCSGRSIARGMSPWPTNTLQAIGELPIAGERCQIGFALNERLPRVSGSRQIVERPRPHWHNADSFRISDGEHAQTQNSRLRVFDVRPDMSRVCWQPNRPWTFKATEISRKQPRSQLNDGSLTHARVYTVIAN